MLLKEYYSDIIVASGVLLLFLGGYLCFGAVPKKEVFKQYKRSRTILGGLLIVWAFEFLIIWILDLRENAPHIATIINLTMYYLACLLFSAAFISLLDNSYINRKQIIIDTTKFIIFVIIIWIATLYANKTIATWIQISAALFFLVDTARLSIKLYTLHQKTKKQIEGYYSEGVDSFILWMPRSIYYVVIMGLLGGLLAFAPKWAVSLYAISGMIMFIYLFCSLQNYMINFEEVETAVKTFNNNNSDTENQNFQNTKLSEDKQNEIGFGLQNWINKNYYCQPKITIGMIADEIKTNRTYLSNYINSNYNCTFREWINNLRIEHAKQLLIENNDKTILTIAEELGYSSDSFFIRQFKATEGVTPTKWLSDHKNSSTT